MSDWEPVEPDPFVGGAGGNQVPTDTSGSPEVPQRYSKEELAAMFADKVNNLWEKHRTNTLRYKVFSERQLEVRELKDSGAIRRDYSQFIPRDGEFDHFAEAQFKPRTKNWYVLETAEKFGSNHESIKLEDFSWGNNKKENDFNLEVTISMRDLEQEKLSEEVVIHYEGQGGGFDSLRIELFELGKIYENDEFNDDDHRFVETVRLDTLLSGEVDLLEWEVGIRHYEAHLEKEGEDDREKVFVVLRRDDGAMRARIPARIPIDIVEQLFPTKIFAKDPYSVNLADDKWVQADWQSMLGGLHWEHSVPQVKDKDTELPGNK